MMPTGKDGRVDEALAATVAEDYEKTKAVPQRASAQRQTPTGLPALQSADPSADTRETPESQRE